MGIEQHGDTHSRPASADESLDDTDDRYGGVGYDGRSRPDLSNTAYFLDALEATGVPKDDPAVQPALTFLQPHQGLKVCSVHSIAVVVPTARS